MYIPPEDIGKFSLICRASNRVVNTVYFWMRLFQKYDHFFDLFTSLIFLLDTTNPNRRKSVVFLFTNISRSFVRILSNHFIKSIRYFKIVSIERTLFRKIRIFFVSHDVYEFGIRKAQVPLHNAMHTIIISNFDSIILNLWNNNKFEIKFSHLFYSKPISISSIKIVVFFIWSVQISYPLVLTWEWFSRKSHWMSVVIIDIIN